MNSKHSSWDHLPGREYEMGDSLSKRTFLRQCCNISPVPSSFSVQIPGIVWISGRLYYTWPTGVLCFVCVWREAGAGFLPPLHGISFLRENGDEGKEKIAKNQRADESSRCLCWIGPHFCLTSSGKWEFAQIKLWQDEIKLCFTTPHLTCSG